MADKFSDDQVVIAWTGFAVDMGGAVRVVAKRTKLRANDPVVRRVPAYFVAADVPEGEWPSEFDRALEESMRSDAAEKAERARHSAPAIPDERAVEVIQAFQVGFTQYPEGRRFDRDDPLVKKHPQFFAVVTRTPLV